MSRDVPSDAERVVSAIDELRQALLVLAAVNLYAILGTEDYTLDSATMDACKQWKMLRDIEV